MHTQMTNAHAKPDVEVKSFLLHSDIVVFSENTIHILKHLLTLNVW